MARRSKKYFWHVPPDAWYSGVPDAVGGEPNTLQDIVVHLVDTETVQSARPDIDNFVVERIVGQYQLSKNETTSSDDYWHSRIYVAQTNATATALRSLNSADDAETSFLWHQVDGMEVEADGDVWGSWQARLTGARPVPTPFMGRNGHLDIRVGRRLEGGEALIWHTQIVAAPTENNVCFVKLWIRLLVREA